MPKRILIAEDDLEVKELLTMMATRFGYEVTSVTDGAELLAIVAEKRFDVIITDLIMPNLNGASAAEILKLQGNTTPVIALTALNRQDLALVTNKFIRVFHKPYDVRELFQYVDSLPTVE